MCAEIGGVFIWFSCNVSDVSTLPSHVGPETVMATDWLNTLGTGRGVGGWSCQQISMTEI